MDDGKTTGNDELDDVIVTDESDAPDTDTNDSSIEGEQDQTGIDLDTTPTKSNELTPAQVEAKKQEDAWYAKVISGKASIDKVPAWLHPRVKSRMDTLMGSNEDIEARLEKKANEIAERKAFEDLKGQLPPMTKQQKEALQSNFKELAPLGKLKALQKAMAIAGVSVEKVEDKRNVKLPHPSNVASKKQSNDAKSIVENEDSWKEYLGGIEHMNAQ